MKYIKTYERIDEFIDDLNYKPGDYVLLNIPQILKNIQYDNGASDLDEILSDKAKITEIINNDEYPYRIIFDISDNTTSVSEDEILRLLTNEEIFDFETKKTSNRYNI